MPTASKDAIKYELTFILGEAAGETEGTAKTAEVTEAIKKMGGEVEKSEQWGRRELAYVIRRNRSGFYVTMWFTLPADQVRVLEQQLRFDEQVIRSLVTKAYTTAQPGSLYPVAEEEKTAKPARAGRRTEKEETATAEEELRRTSTSKKAAPAKAEATEEAEEISEEERLKKLDESLGELLKDEE